VTQDGAGTVTLGSANTYSGGTILNSGTLQLTGSGTLGATNGNVWVNNVAAILDLGSLTVTNATIALGNGTIQNGTLAAARST